MTELTQTQLDQFFEKLKTLQGELQAQYSAGRKSTDTVVLDQSMVGRLSRMDALQQQSMAQSTQRHVEQRLRGVNLALAKFDSGDYGYCESCGGDIDPQRLTAQPEASCCFACQSQQEYYPQS
jgi:DnaK suppressor protein